MSQDTASQDFNITQLANTVREMRRMAAEVRHLVELSATDPNIDGAAQRAHVLLPLATDALGELALAFMASDDVEGEPEASCETPRPKSYLTDEDFAAKHRTTLDSPASPPAHGEHPADIYLPKGTKRAGAPAKAPKPIQAKRKPGRPKKAAK